MKKNSFEITIVGGTVGIATAQIISVLYSVIRGGGNYYPVFPGFAEELGGEIRAVVVQNLLAMACGIVWTLAFQILKQKDMSESVKTTLFLLVMGAVTLPTLYYLALRWLPNSRRALIGASCTFFGYLIVWRILDYFSARKNVRQINERLDAYRRDDDL